jgi:hypothetical protein
LAYRDVDFPVAKGASPTVTAAVDDSAQRTVETIGTEDFLVLNLGQDPAFIRALQLGRMLSFRTQGLSAAIELYPNTGTVLDELQACLDFHLTPPSSPPAGPASGSKQPEEPSAPAEDEDDLAALVLKAIVIAGYPSPILESTGGGYSWSSNKTSMIGTFLVNDPGYFPDAYVARMETLGAGCGASLRLSFGPVLKTRSGREVYTATLQCSEADYEIHQASLVDVNVALMFFHLSTAAEGSRAAEINRRLRDYLRDSW